MSVQGVVFDLDGVLVDSEQVWDAARRELVEETGGEWRDGATEEMLGMSSPEWSAYVHDELGVPLEPPEISARVAAHLAEHYRRALPLLPGAQDAVERMAVRRPLGLATSSNREIIDLFLELSGLADRFATTLSSEEVARGKPAPDVYLEVVRRLEAEPARCVAIEDSTSGLRSAAAAGLAVVAVPNPHFPPHDDALALADVVLDSLEELTAEQVERLR